MLFLLKLIVKLIRLFVRAITFPFRLAFRLIRGDDGSSEEYDVEDFEADLDTETDDTTAGTEGGTTTDSGGGTTIGASSVATAQKHIRRYEYGLYAVGAVMTVSGLFLLSELMAMGGSRFLATLVPAGTIGTIIVAVWALAAGLGVRRGSTLAYYLGMVYLVFVGVAFFLLIPIVGAVGYFGYSGKSVLGEDISALRESDDTSSPTPSSDTSDQPANSPTAAAASMSDAEPGSVSSGQPETAADDVQAAESTPTPADATSDSSRQPERSPNAGLDGAAGDDMDSDPPGETPSADTSATPDAETEQTDTDDGESAASSEKGIATPQDALTEFDDRLTAADAAERRAACEELARAIDTGDVPVDAAVDRLVDRLETDDDSAVRQAACEALGQAGTTQANRALEAHRLDPDTATSKAASRALRGNTPS